MPTETAGRPTLEQAIDQSFQQHSDSSEDEHAAETDAGTPEGTTDDTDGGAQATEQTQAGDQSAEAADDALLSPEEVEKLSEDNRAQYKQIQAAFTRKRQEDAEARRAWETEQTEAKSDLEFVRELRANPEAVIRNLAAQVGLEVAQSEQPAVSTEFTLPENFSFLKPVIDPLLEQNRLLKAEVAELKESLGPIKDNARAASTEAAMAKMDQLQPGWRKFESQMVKEAQNFPQPAGMDGVKYLQYLYRQVAWDARQGDTLRTVAEKAKASVKASQPEGTGVSGDKVRHTLPEKHRGRGITNDLLRDALEAARRGEEWAR